MPRRKKTYGSTTPAKPKASPSALPPSDQSQDQIASIKVSGDGRVGKLVVDNPTPESLSRLMAAFGTKDLDFFEGLLSQIGRVRSREDEPASQTVGFMLSVVKNQQPRNELEAMLLAQMAACHKIAMDLTSRLNNPEDYRLFVKIMKTFADLKETFDRGRKSTEHSFMVQNMTVKDGGQAIVGNVTQRSTKPDEEKTAPSTSLLTDERTVPLPRVDKSPELAPQSPAAQQGDDLLTCGEKDD